MTFWNLLDTYKWCDRQIAPHHTFSGGIELEHVQRGVKIEKTQSFMFIVKQFD